MQTMLEFPRRPRTRRRLTPRQQIWVIVTFLHEDCFWGARYLSRDTKGSVWGGSPVWTDDPRQAWQWRSRQAAHQMMKRLDIYEGQASAMNLTWFGCPS